MPPHSFLRWPSRGTSSLALTTAAGILRCGKLITTDAARGSDQLPAGEKTCESCLAGVLRDEDASSGPSDAEVPA